VLARREGKSVNRWIYERNTRAFTTPGWWKVPGIGMALIVVGFIAVVTVQDGFKPASLLVIPIFAAFYALAVLLISAIYRAPR
jgi:hypothetical protein